MALPALRPLSTGEILDVGFALYRAMFLRLISISAICQIIPIAWGMTSPSGLWLEHPLRFGLRGLLALVANAIGVAATTRVIARAYLGEQVTAQDALQKTLPLVPRLIGVSVLVGGLTVIGFLMLVVPGIIWGAAWSVVVPVVVLEHTQGVTAAMRRSWHLTMDFRGKALVALFAASMLLVIPMMAVTMVLAALAGGVPNNAVTEGVAGFFRIFVTPFTYSVLVVLYYDLRIRKEGLDLELLADSTATS